MNRQDGSRAAARQSLQCQTQLLRIHREAVGLDVDERRGRAGALDRSHRGDRGVGHGEDKVTGAQATAAQRQFDRVRPAGAADAIRDPDEGRESGLEGLDLRAEDILAAVENASDRGVNRRTLGQIGSTRVRLRDRDDTHRLLKPSTSGMAADRRLSRNYNSPGSVRYLRYMARSDLRP